MDGGLAPGGPPYQCHAVPPRSAMRTAASFNMPAGTRLIPVVIVDQYPWCEIGSLQRRQILVSE